MRSVEADHVADRYRDERLGCDRAAAAWVRAPPTASVRDGKLTVTAPGPIAGGTVFDMPAVRLLLVADRPGTVTTAPGGSGWEDLGFAFTRLVVGESEYGPLQCYPDPAQPRTFTTTTVTSRPGR